jgi:hypothetical protein
MGVDAAQIGAHQAGGDDRSVRFGHAMGDEQAPGEGVGRARRGVDALDLDGLRCGHQSLISCTCFARAVQAPMRKARSVPVET